MTPEGNTPSNPAPSTGTQGYWNGLPTTVRRCTGIVQEWNPETDPPQAWWKGLAGQRVQAVEVHLDGVNYGGGVDYLYDGDGSGWHKVTEGRGSPHFGHANISLTDIEYEDG